MCAGGAPAIVKRLAVRGRAENAFESALVVAGGFRQSWIVVEWTWTW